MKRIIELTEKLGTAINAMLDRLGLPKDQWNMDPNHRVEWLTDYGEGDAFARQLDAELSNVGTKFDLILKALSLKTISFSYYIKKKFRLKTNDEYLEKLRDLLVEEVEAHLLDKERDHNLVAEYANVKFLGADRYNPSYDHAAYVAKAKKNAPFKHRGW